MTSPSAIKSWGYPSPGLPPPPQRAPRTGLCPKQGDAPHRRCHRASRARRAEHLRARGRCPPPPPPSPFGRVDRRLKYTKPGRPACATNLARSPCPGAPKGTSSRGWAIRRRAARTTALASIGHRRATFPRGRRNKARESCKDETETLLFLGTKQTHRSLSHPPKSSSSLPQCREENPSGQCLTSILQLLPSQ